MPLDRFIIYDQTLRAMAYAIKGNDLQELQSIINKDVVLKPYITEIDTAVHYAAAFNRQECLKLLIDNNFSLGAVDRFGCTPLDIAAMLGHLEMVCFIARQLPKEILAESALSAARFAAFQKQKSVVMLLLKYANDDVDIFRDVHYIRFVENLFRIGPFAMFRYLTNIKKKGRSDLVRMVSIILAAFRDEHFIIILETLICNPNGRHLSYARAMTAATGLKANYVKLLRKKYDMSLLD
ncbi:unnamed protein product [Hymenolepis diminuta]|nr:unnamed protein product [Hymenolepis diminuta]